MDAYNEIFLEKEMANQDQEWRFNDIAQISQLAEKTAIIDEARDRRLTFEKVQLAAIAFAQDRAADLLYAGVELSNVFEPGFMRRARQRRRHLARLEVSDAEAARVVVKPN